MDDVTVEKSSFFYVYDDASSGDLDHKFLQEIDRVGIASGQAQNLNHAITSVEKLKGSGHTIILSCCADTSDSQIICNGFIKYGVKDLYFYLRDGKIIQSTPTCLLDFFVEESLQRNGLGLRLFEKMLQVAKETPEKVAYDRPSPKLFGFMRKHFNLVDPDLQPNRYAIYQGFHI